MLAGGQRGPSSIAKRYYKVKAVRAGYGSARWSVLSRSRHNTYHRLILDVRDLERRQLRVPGGLDQLPRGRGAELSTKEAHGRVVAALSILGMQTKDVDDCRRKS